jgi:hypothetical protein
MTNPSTDQDLDVTYTGVLVDSKEHVVVPGVIDKFVDDQRDHAIVFHREDDAWWHQMVDDSIAGVSVAREPTMKILHLCIDGEVAVSTLPGKAKEHVDTSANGPNRSAFMRCMRKIDGNVYAAGLARQVYRRLGPDNWTRIDQGAFVDRSQRTETIGFNAIDGFAASSIYAVGYGGEIWHFNGTGWVETESPTNVVLTGVKCLASGDVVVCGMAGTLLRGDSNGWRVIPQSATEADFWGIAEFRGRVYVSNREGLYLLDDADLTKVDMGIGVPVTTAYVDADSDVLWSVGHKDLVSTVDGIAWVVIDKP